MNEILLSDFRVKFGRKGGVLSGVREGRGGVGDDRWAVHAREYGVRDGCKGVGGGRWDAWSVVCGARAREAVTSVFGFG